MYERAVLVQRPDQTLGPRGRGPQTRPRWRSIVPEAGAVVRHRRTIRGSVSTRENGVVRENYMSEDANRVAPRTRSMTLAEGRAFHRDSLLYTTRAASLTHSWAKRLCLRSHAKLSFTQGVF